MSIENNENVTRRLMTFAQSKLVCELSSTVHKDKKILNCKPSKDEEGFIVLTKKENELFPFSVWHMNKMGELSIAYHFTDYSDARLKFWERD